MYIDKETAPTLLTEKHLLPSLVYDSLESGNAITLWRLPNSNEKHLLICSGGLRHLDDLTLEGSDPGFVFAPFDSSQKKTFFKSDLIITFKDGTLHSDVPEDMLQRVSRKVFPAAESLKTFPVQSRGAAVRITDYKSLVSECISRIRDGAFEKIVPSRAKEVDLADDFDPVKAFDKLCQAYPNCMISMVSSEETGTWIGATPELLVSVDDQMTFRTVSLAGTQRYTPGMNLHQVAWTEKEIEEQALVCRYIISCFKKIRLREYDEHGPRTAVAGNLLHLKSEYVVDMVATNFPQLGSVMLQLLHPTSAVCGMPLEPARQFLVANEGYERQYYSGFLGPVNVRNESSIFVNLRCMQLTGKKATLYAGAGVTIDSIPEKELEETEMKFETLLSALR